VIGAGVPLATQAPRGLGKLLFGLLPLLAIGLRNAWDMTVWVIDRRRN
jgi:hypothetical protein